MNLPKMMINKVKMFLRIKINMINKNKPKGVIKTTNIAHLLEALLKTST